MKVTVVPAGPKTGAAAIRSLLELSTGASETLEITAVYRNVQKAPGEFTSLPNFKAVQGDVSDLASLDFTGANAVIAITPPAFDAGDIVEKAEGVSQNVKDAVEKATTVERLALLSSIGAHLRDRVGEIKTNNAAERILAKTNVPHVVFIRCAYFMENWTMELKTLKAPEPFFLSTVTPLDYPIPMVAVKDVGAALAHEVLTEKPRPKSPCVYELHGPRKYSPRDVQAAFTKAIGKDVNILAVEKEELPEFFAKVFPPSLVGEWVEMSLSFLPGGAALENLPPEEERHIVRGKTDLQEAMRTAWVA